MIYSIKRYNLIFQEMQQQQQLIIVTHRTQYLKTKNEMHKDDIAIHNAANKSFFWTMTSTNTAIFNQGKC